MAQSRMKTEPDLKALYIIGGIAPLLTLIFYLSELLFTP